MPCSYPVLLVLSFSLLLRVADASSGCFWRNGTENPSSDYSPCTAPHLSTVCCSIRDVCLDNGLCRANTGLYWRETCTSRDWKTGVCLDVCTDSKKLQGDDTIMTPCDGSANSKIWCCGESDECCAIDSNITRHTIVPQFRGGLMSLTPTTISSAGSTASRTSISTTPATSSTGLVTSIPSAGLSTGAKAGIGIGAGVGALALIGLGILIATMMRRRKERKAPGAAASSYTPMSYYKPPVYEAEAEHRYELGNGAKPAECDARQDVVELPSSDDGIIRADVARRGAKS